MSGEFSMSIKMGKYEIQLSGSKEDVIEILDRLPRIIGSLTEAFNLTMKEAKSIIEEATEAEEYPTLTIPPSANCPEAIISILSTDWGRKTPRTLKEILEALKLNALHYPKGTVSGRLADMTRKGILRRVKTERGYGYILIQKV